MLEHRAGGNSRSAADAADASATGPRALAGQPSLVRERFGATEDGTEVELWTLATGDGVEASISTRGCAVQALWLPGRDGEPVDVVLGYARLAGYLGDGTSYLGAVVGRYANRIANASFALDGVTHRLSANDGPSCLHGGARGFDGRVWRVTRTRLAEDAAALSLRHASADGEEGFPGALVAEVTYTLAGGELRVDYRATTDRPTVLNLTSHVYWNLAGEGSGSIEGHELELAASRYLPVDAHSIPTGEVAAVAGTPFDFTRPRAIGERIRGGPDRAGVAQLALTRGYDHHFVLDREGGSGLALAARLHDPASGRAVEVLTTEPGLQVYSGNYLDGSASGTGGRLYRQCDGIALETQHCPDSPNRPEFPSTVLRPGELFASTTVYRLSAG